jgi:hypothetical protein
MNTEDHDMDENQFWVTTWKIIGAVVVAMTVSMGSCTANRHYQTRLLIENTGVDPIGAKCAIEGEGDNSSVCIQRAGRTP